MVARSKTGASILALAAVAALAPVPASAVVMAGGTANPAVTAGLHIAAENSVATQLDSDLDAPKSPVDHLTRLIDALPEDGVDYDTAVDVRIAQSLYESLDEGDRGGYRKIW